MKQHPPTQVGDEVIVPKRRGVNLNNKPQHLLFIATLELLLYAINNVSQDLLQKQGLVPLLNYVQNVN